MARRSETCIYWTDLLCGGDTGWRTPTPNDVVLHAPGCTPVWGSKAEGRGTPLIDIVSHSGHRAISLKFGERNQTTRVLTCGTAERHIPASLSRIRDGRPFWAVILVHDRPESKGLPALTGKVMVMAFDIARVDREHGLKPAMKGQGKQNPHPFRIRYEVSRDKTDKVYDELSLGWTKTRAEAQVLLDFEDNFIPRLGEFLNSLETVKRKLAEGDQLVG